MKLIALYSVIWDRTPPRHDHMIFDGVVLPSPFRRGIGEIKRWLFIEIWSLTRRR
jgi:hypothetical protein